MSLQERADELGETFVNGNFSDAVAAIREHENAPLLAVLVFEGLSSIDRALFRRLLCEVKK